MARKYQAMSLADQPIEVLRAKHEHMLLRTMPAPNAAGAAMHTLAEEFGLPYWTQRNLREKRQRKAPRGFGKRLRAAYLRVLAHSIRNDLSKLREEAQHDGVGSDACVLADEMEELLSRLEAAVQQAET